MTMTEDDRYHPYQQLEGALDARGATTMMELLPPGGLGRRRHQTRPRPSGGTRGPAV
ncbi:hypothetical protein BN381_290002 [Candidatus Microthrix parvicella RN1]|uniref:Uncharacterized protein n=1 Tax=Candidatus Neomicrothrix parvicella RN1 TaxID=1229780 RepID=R4YYZ0_9ACTN|nr:hypothetical protein BN381_290002 [Candidatus Microthrix parvicella RN1]